MLSEQGGAVGCVSSASAVTFFSVGALGWVVMTGGCRGVSRLLSVDAGYPGLSELWPGGGAGGLLPPWLEGGLSVPFCRSTVRKVEIRGVSTYSFLARGCGRNWSSVMIGRGGGVSRCGEVWWRRDDVGSLAGMGGRTKCVAEERSGSTGAGGSDCSVGPPCGTP